jgi:hypothetical protein
VQFLGLEYDRHELRKRIGHLSQIAGIRPVEWLDGSDRGLRAFDFNTGSGLQFTLLADRALDICDATFHGFSLCYHSPAGVVSPALYDLSGTGWPWSPTVGLLTTWGMTRSALTGEEDEEDYGTAGNLSAIPARSVSFGADWEGEEYVMWAEGEVRQARPVGLNLRLQRSVHAWLGEAKIFIKDTIENQGFARAPLFLLYQCNFGFPLLNEGAELIAVIEDLQARDEAAERAIDSFDRFEAPQPDYDEQVFYLEHDADDKDIVRTALVNRSFHNNQGLGVYLKYSKKELLRCTLWKMLAEGVYIAGVVPGNCLPALHNGVNENDTLNFIEPGESRTFHLEIGVLASNSDIRTFENSLRGLDF